MSLLTSSRVIAASASSVLSGFIQTRFCPTLSIFAARRRWLLRSVISSQLPLVSLPLLVLSFSFLLSFLLQFLQLLFHLSLLFPLRAWSISRLILLFLFLWLPQESWLLSSCPQCVQCEQPAFWGRSF